jgi:tetratricopeptide (TPR) repeat protein
MAAARELVGEIPPDLMVNLVDFLDIFTATPLHVMVRFGMWDEILAEPEPVPELLAARAVWHYARGIALATLGRVDQAVAEQQAFVRAKAAVPGTRLLFNNPVAEILAVADAVLAGEIDYRRGEFVSAFAHLRRAVQLDEKLNYDEPWGWMEPARHALGALLIEQRNFDEAELVYRQNLERYPENGWALHGLAECLEKTGRGAEANSVRARFAKAFAKADVEIPGSCYCRRQQ